jgi:hypothetical protein
MGGFGKKYKTKLGCEKYFVGLDTEHCQSCSNNTLMSSYESQVIKIKHRLFLVCLEIRELQPKLRWLLHGIVSVKNSSILWKLQSPTLNNKTSRCDPDKTLPLNDSSQYHYNRKWNCRSNPQFLYVYSWNQLD